MAPPSPTRVLGIEGTAWAASAAVYDVGLDDVTTMETEVYRPASGGIHPREAAEHMAEAIPVVLERVLEAEGTPDAVAFSRGPGLGPCLRIVATAARTLAQRFEVPLIGVNHMVAHLEVGRHTAGFDDPVCLNASGANAHVLAYRDGRYRVLGETMDTGVGNAIDKFTRHLGWSHPGGPKVERAAADGEYLELSYVVKGMDFSFSGIMSAAKEAVDAGERVEDVCCSLQETIFAMLTEVSERALSLTGRDELVLGGGVGQNRRLRTMLEAMCEDRGASFHAPPDRFLRDNAGMIAMLGATMLEAGETIAVEDSRVDPSFRPDRVPVRWRPEDVGAAGHVDDTDTDTVLGAEATVTVGPDRVTKRRLPKRYRHPSLDERLRRRRTVREARLTSAARRAGVPTPVIEDVDPLEGTIVFQHVGDADLLEAPSTPRVRAVGRHLARLHGAGIVHGDPTPRNVRVDRDRDPDRDRDRKQEQKQELESNREQQPQHDRPRGRVYLIDFGLGFHSNHPEDHAMDLHVFLQGIEGLVEGAETYREAFEAGYGRAGDVAVLEQLRAIEGRGRYR